MPDRSANAPKSAQNTSALPTAGDLAQVMDQIAPTQYAEEWDNVGLLIGSPGRLLDGPVVLTIDPSEAVIEEAVALGAAAIVTYHPVLFHSTRRLTTLRPRDRVALRCAEMNIAVYSPHTALDAAEGGMNDWLCEGVSGSHEVGRIAGDRRALSPIARLPERQRVKIVTFVPERDAGRVRDALATAGAGHVGEYELCSFGAPGTGTFFGGDGTNPRVGEKGRLEAVGEVRLEMVCPRRALAVAIETLRQFHPYEEPVIDVYDLAALPDRYVGPGRKVMLDQPVTLTELAARIKQFLGVSMVKVADARQFAMRRNGRETTVRSVAVCAGAGASLAPLAVQNECEVFFTGEMTYHEVWDLLNEGCSVILAGHSNTERGYLPRLAERLRAALPGVNAVVSKSDRSPLVTM